MPNVRLLLGSSSLLLLGCASAQSARSRPTHDTADTAETTIFLIGDSGEPGPQGHAVLDALAGEARRARGQRVIIFLGDNLYPDGMPATVASDRAAAEMKLQRALDVIIRSGARGVFVPGNHDWGPANSLGTLAREEQFISHVSYGTALMLPANGCPGPAVLDIGRSLRLTLLDTEWWLRDQAARRAAGCDSASEGGVVRSLRHSLLTAGPREVIVAGHHPLISGGPHGGHFGWREHVFPLRDMANWMWLPLPVVGSVYPFTRPRVGLTEDVSGSANSRLRAALESAFVQRSPLIYASGHDHGLQVLRGASAEFLLVSGGGSDGDLNSVHALPETLYDASANGFMRVEVLPDRRVRLVVVTVEGEVTNERFVLWLR